MRLDPITLTCLSKLIFTRYVVLHVKTVRNQKSDPQLLNRKRGDSANWLFRTKRAPQQPVKPDDHSEVVPLLPIPNRTVKRLSADDSAGSRVKVGHRQATIRRPPISKYIGGLRIWAIRTIATLGLPQAVRTEIPLNPPECPRHRAILQKREKPPEPVRVGVSDP